MQASARALAAALLFGFVSLPVAAHEGGHGNEVMWQACGDRELNDSCSFENAAGQINRGSCQMMVDHLICVRNQPLESTAASGLVGSPNDVAGSANDKSWYGWLAVILALAVVCAALFLRIKGQSGKPPSDDKR